MKPQGLSAMQQDVDTWIRQFPEGYWENGNMLAQLAEEVGEVARVINFIDGVKKTKPGESTDDLGSEIADVFFSLISMANKHKVDLDQERNKLMKERRYGRDQERFEK